MRLGLVGLVVVLSFAACGDGSSSPADPDGSPWRCSAPTDPGYGHSQYVADQLLLPIQATGDPYGMNLDNDELGRPDNAIGQILTTINTMANLNLQDGLDERVAAGDVLNLFDVQANALTTAAGVGVIHTLGSDCDAPTQPADNFSGQEAFIATEMPPGVLVGTIVGGVLDAGPGTMTVRIVLFGSTPIDLPLIGARIRAEISETGMVNGRIGGAIVHTEVRQTVIPALARSAQQVIDEQCTGTAPDCCPDGGEGGGYIELFDSNDDCEVSADEIETNALVSALFAPDVDMLNSAGEFDPRRDGVADALSFGFGFSAVGARFDRPSP